MAYLLCNPTNFSDIWVMPAPVKQAFTCLKEHCFSVRCKQQEMDIALLYYNLHDAKHFVRSILTMGPHEMLVDVVPLGPLTEPLLHQVFQSLNSFATNLEGQQILLGADLANNFHSDYILADYAWTLKARLHWGTFDLDEFHPNDEWQYAPLT